MAADSPITFPPELPISARAVDIASAIAAHQVVIVAGATGSGKTTQLPKIALAMGRGLETIIGVTQPRRIAATSVAARVAEELGSPLGTDVGYQIRFEDRTTAQTYVKFMTDGILLAEIQGDPLLRKYDTIILDEAHERSLTIDFLLGWVKRILPERPDLKVIVSSATLETDRFSTFFGGAPIIEVEGRTFPVDVLYERPDDDDDLGEAVAKAVANVTSLDPHGDILVFLPGEREIREAENAINARRLWHTVVQPLYARLSASDQARVFKSIPERRVILATNVAETSITIPGIVYVVDTGVARLSRYDPRSGTTRLQVEGISRASAEQRKGRCGRVRDGICVRLYDEESFAARPAFTDPEIKRTGLAGVILRMKSLGLGAVEDFPFIDPPPGKAIAEGYRVLEELGALDEERSLTPLGKQLARFPVDPRIGRMILAGADLACLQDVVVVAAGLSSQDPRERPREKQQQADDLHRRFRDDRSDFVSMLRLWDFVKEAERTSTSNLRRVCRDNFLSFIRVREWFEIARQLEDVVRELGLKHVDGKPDHDALHKALLTGLLSRVGMWSAEARMYVGAKSTRFAIHPGSGVAKKPPAWIMAFELVETSQLFARTVARVDPEWLLVAGKHLLRSSFSDPHWSEKSARASVREHVTLFGLSVAKDRSVDWSNVAPEEARQMFIVHALVRGEYDSRGSFHAKNRAVLEEVARLRDKARRSDMLADEDALVEIFDARVPATIVNGKLFEVWRAEAEKSDPNILVLRIEDVLRAEQELLPSDYPDHIRLHGVDLALAYKFDPGADDDGVTLTVPLVLVPQIAPGELDWTIPGWHRDKIAALLWELSRAARKDLGDLNDLARALATELRPFEGPMIQKLVAAIEALTGVSLDVDAFRPDLVTTHLRLLVRIVDGEGRVVGKSREARELLERFGARAREVLKEVKAPATWDRRGLATWEFGELPRFVERRVGNLVVRSWPALVDAGKSVDLVLLESEAAATEATRMGVNRLFLLGARQALSAITPRLPSAFARPNGAMLSRNDQDAFRAMLLARIAEAAYELEGDAPVLPRDRTTFDARLRAGTPRLDPIFKFMTKLVTTVAAELDKTLAALRSASKHPSGRIAVQDMFAQLEQLFPVDLIATAAVSRLEQLPRYLRAIQARLVKAVNDPRKDADKLAFFTPLWTPFLAKRVTYKDRAAAEDVRWLFEELRVAIFAQELKTPVPVSIAKVSAALAALK